MSTETNVDGEKQEPLKPEKKGMSMPLMIGAAVGVLVIVMLGVVLGVVVASKFIMPQPAATHEATAAKSGHSSNSGEFESEGRMLKNLHEVMLLETGRITTNPKGEASVFVVVNFGMEFKKLDPDNEELKKIAGAEGEVDHENPIMKKLMATMRGKLNNMLASYTKDELLAKRGELPEMVKKELKPIFKEYELALGNVTIQEFIIQ